MLKLSQPLNVDENRQQWNKTFSNTRRIDRNH